MDVINIRMDDMGKRIIPIGIQEENEYRRILIDCKTIFEQYPDADAELFVLPPRGEIYKADIVRNQNIIVWNITRDDLAEQGTGQIQIRFAAGSVIAMSPIARISICRAL